MSLKGVFSGAGHSFLSPASLLFFPVISQSSDTFLEENYVTLWVLVSYLQISQGTRFHYVTGSLGIMELVGVQLCIISIYLIN